MDITGGVNFNGNSIIRSASNIIRYTMTNNNGVPNQPLIESYIDFEQATEYLRCLSQELKNQTPNGVVNPQSWGGLFLQGTDPDLNIFTFDGTNINGTGLTLQNVNTFNIQVPEGSTVLINVLGEDLGFQNAGMLFNGQKISREQNKLIFWNLPDALNLTSTGILIRGSLLAPYATADMNNGNVEGNLILLNLRGNIEEHNDLFEGCLPEVDCPGVLSIVGDFVWNDVNKNGLIDVGESGVGGVTATLYNCDGTSTGLSTVTDSNGFYYITNVPAGNYYVQFSTLPNNYRFVTTGNLVDFTGKTACFDIIEGQFLSDKDAPIVYSSNPTASIGDFVWFDINRNGQLDPGGVGVPNVTVTLYNCDDTPTGLSTTTNADGYYEIQNIPPGEYYVIFSNIPTNYEFITVSNLVDENGKTDCFTLEGGEINNDIDAPIAPILGSIGDLVWNDLNRNGVVDPGEPGIGGVTVTLYNCNDDTPTGLSATTDANGNYLIENVLPGEYIAVFSNIPPNYEFVTVGNYVTDTGVTPTCFTVSAQGSVDNINAPIIESECPICPPGPPGCKGERGQKGSCYTKESAQLTSNCNRIICENNAIVFDYNVYIKCKSIIHNENDSIIKLFSGIYLINYSVSVQSNNNECSNAILGIVLDYKVYFGSESSVSIRPYETVNVFGTSIINVESFSYIGLFNLSCNPICVSKVTMTIVKIG